MARKNVRVKIPVKKLDKLIKLGEDIKAKHVALGVNSPLDNAFVAELDGRTQDAKTKRKDAAAAAAKSQALNNQARVILGVDKGQTSNTGGTVLYLLTSARGMLLNKYRGTEESLSEFGFEVVISQSTPGRKKKKP
jgi:hypothetical protein